IRDRWNNLTDEDIRQINGRFDQLINKLQQRYGYSRDTAEDEVRNWTFDRARAYAHGIRDEETWRTRRTEDNTALKWILGIGIPLLLILSALAYNAARTYQPTIPGQVTQEGIVMSADDRMITQNIRRALFETNAFNPDTLNNLNIEAANGVVTIRGS